MPFGPLCLSVAVVVVGVVVSAVINLAILRLRFKMQSTEMLFVGCCKRTFQRRQKGQKYIFSREKST